MGGNKKKTLAAMEKEQMREELKKMGALEKKKEKKPAEEKTKSKSEFIMTLTDAEVMNVIRTMPYVTPYQISKTLGVKVSVAKDFLEQLRAKGYLKIVGGVSGRYIYVPVTAAG